MKKTMIATAIAFCLIAFWLIAQNAKSEEERQPITMNPEHIVNEQPNTISNEKQTDPIESNQDLLQRFCETIFQADDESDLAARLHGIAGDELIGAYTKGQGNVVEAHHYTTSIHHANYLANETMGVAIFELRTKTEMNESAQMYLLQVSIKNGLIETMIRLVPIEE